MGDKAFFSILRVEEIGNDRRSWKFCSPKSVFFWGGGERRGEGKMKGS